FTSFFLVENDDHQLKMCKLSQSSGSCFCLLLDGKNLNSTDFECSICCNLLWLPITTPCGHVFCRECVIRSVDNTQAKCPMCKSSLQNARIVTKLVLYLIQLSIVFLIVFSYVDTITCK
ncbi:unnamed protein product, partial [Rotaria magnacalcarata]